MGWDPLMIRAQDPWDFFAAVKGWNAAHDNGATESLSAEDFDAMKARYS